MPYHQVKIKEEPGGNAKKAPETGDRETRSLTQLVQKAVNQTRRATARHKKIQEDLQAFLCQHEKYLRDVDYYETESRKAQEASTQAEEKLKEVLHTGAVVPMGADDLQQLAEDQDPGKTCSTLAQPQVWGQIAWRTREDCQQLESDGTWKGTDIKKLRTATIFTCHLRGATLGMQFPMLWQILMQIMQARPQCL